MDTRPRNLKNLLSVVLSAVNVVRSQSLHHRLFKVFCNEVGAQRNVLGYLTEVKWLPRVLARVFELHKEIEQLLRH